MILLILGLSGCGRGLGKTLFPEPGELLIGFQTTSCRYYCMLNTQKPGNTDVISFFDDFWSLGPWLGPEETQLPRAMGAYNKIPGHLLSMFIDCY